MDRRYDLGIALTIIALGIFVLAVTRTLRMGYFVRDPVGPRAFFYGLGVLFIFGGGWVAMKLLRGWKSQKDHMIPAEGKEDDEGHPASALRAAAIMGIGIGYYALLNPLGYLLSTPLYIIGALLVLGERRWWLMVVVSVSFTVIFYATFAQMLGVRVPVGPFAELFRSLGWIYL